MRVPDDDADAGVLFEVEPADREWLGEHVDETLGDLFGFGGSGEPFGEVEELVAAEATQRVGRARDEFEATRDRRQELVTDEVSVGVVHALEVVEVEEEDARRSHPVARRARGPGLGGLRRAHDWRVP